jgi:hypothetical protein
MLMTRQAQDTLTASALLAVAGGLLAPQLREHVRYLAALAHVEISAADVTSICRRVPAPLL